MYKKVSTDMNFVGREKEVEAFWKEHDIFPGSRKAAWSGRKRSD